MQLWRDITHSTLRMLAEDSRLRRRGQSLRVSNADALAFSLKGGAVLNDLVRIRAGRCFEFPVIWYAENSSIVAFFVNRAAGWVLSGRSAGEASGRRSDVVGCIISTLFPRARGFDFDLFFPDYSLLELYNLLFDSSLHTGHH